MKSLVQEKTFANDMRYIIIFRNGQLLTAD